ncbi:MAG TPA: type II CAAX endopeptidase family protein [Terriglobia bacterium]|nr:type II CAAX endopeptidase family protein [Terriglobia bacterium]
MTFHSETEHHEQSSNLADNPAAELDARPLPEQWRIRDLLIFIAVGFFTLVAANFLVFIGYIFLGPLVHWTAPIEDLKTNVIFLLSFQLVWYILLLAYIYFFITWYYKASFAGALKWKGLSVHRTIRYLLGGAALSLAVVLMSLVLPQQKSYPLEKLFNSPASAYAIAAFAVLVAPFMEELLFRGLLFAFFEKHGGLTFAVAATAILFAGLHIPEYWGAWTNVLMILIVGFAFSIVRGLTGSVTPSFVLHLAYNGSQMLLLFLQTQHFHRMPAGFLIFR